MGPAMEPHVRSLLDSMFAAGLSYTLVEALEHIIIRYLEGLERNILHNLLSTWMKVVT